MNTATLPPIPVTKNKVIVCPPFTSLHTFKDHNIILGAQNVHQSPNGAHTGEVSALMLVEAGVKYVIIGHSERRTQFGETNEVIAQKVNTSLSAGLIPILCISELSELENIGGNIIIAYEPIWAIGTGKTPTLDEIQSMHTKIKSTLNVPVLYGGSVTDQNAHDILAIQNVDGVLVGGASLNAEKFLSIVQYK